jgi:hypothetical protein
VADAFPLSREDADLLVRAAAREKDTSFSDLSVERLAEISREEGIDVATAVFYDRAKRACTLSPEASPALGVLPTVDVIGIVPGAFHGQHKHTGADGLRIKETVKGLAPRVEIIPVRSFGRLDDNAAAILDWLEARHGSRIVLTSLSKGGADLKCALASPRATSAFDGVIAWISFSGIVQGTPLIGWLKDRPLRSTALRLLLRLQGHQTAALDELVHGDDTRLASWPIVPPHLRIVHVCGCPLAKHVRHKWAPRGYERLQNMGPNDGGGILLGDLSRLPGTIFPIWGSDHYLEPDWNITPLLRGIVAAAAS